MISICDLSCDEPTSALQPTGEIVILELEPIQLSLIFIPPLFYF